MFALITFLYLLINVALPLEPIESGERSVEVRASFEAYEQHLHALCVEGDLNSAAFILEQQLSEGERYQGSVSDLMVLVDKSDTDGRVLKGFCSNSGY